MENTAERSRRIWKEQGGQVCWIFQRQQNLAHPWDHPKPQTKDSLAGRDWLVWGKRDSRTYFPCQCFCRRSFTIWDVLLPSEEQAAKVAASNITTKFFGLQLEYRETCRIRVTVCNVLAFSTGEVLASYLSAYGCVEEINLLRSATGTAYRDYTFQLCLTRKGFQAIPETIVSRDRQVMVVANSLATLTNFVIPRQKNPAEHNYYHSHHRQWTVNQGEERKETGPGPV